MDEDKTRIIHRDPQGDGPPKDEDKTRQIGGAEKTQAAASGGERTVLIGRPARKGAGAFESQDPAADDASLDPVVGWLVVVKGPGRGNAVRLGNGWNSIGRDSSQRVRLDYGDAKISRSNHAKLLYDTRSRKFTITLGDGLNPTYLKGEALLAPTELKGRDLIQLGDTELLFVPLCGNDFDWQDEA